MYNEDLDDDEHTEDLESMVNNHTQVELTEDQVESAPAVLTSSSPNTIGFTSGKFALFMDILNILAKTCDSMIIREGVICQRSNDRKNLFDIDMTSIFGNEHSPLLLSSISSKEKLLIPFRKQQSVMECVITDGDYVFRDNYSKIIIQKPIETYLSNAFVSNDFNRIPESCTVVSFDINRQMLDRMSGMAEGLAANTIRVEFDGNKVTIKVFPSDVNSVTEAHLMSITDNIVKDVHGWCTFPISPFQLNVNEYKAVFYYLQFSDRPSEINLKLEAEMRDGEDKIHVMIGCKSILQDD